MAAARRTVTPQRITSQPRPIVHAATARLLDDMLVKMALSVGPEAIEALTAGTETGEVYNRARRKLTADALRQLDEDPTHTPRWLQDANATAKRELAAWYMARGLPGPDDDEDPGEPIPGDAWSAYGHLIERPSPETPERQLVEYLKCRRDVVYFVDSYCWLAHPERGVIPFRLWRWQAWLLHQWQRHALNITLKARQEGVSELAAATALHLARFHDTKTALMLSRGEEEAKVLKGRAELMYSNLPSWLQASDEAPDRVQLGMVNMTVFVIVHRDRQGRARASRIESLPATRGAGRSRTAALVVFDEHAHMMWGAETWAAAKPTVDAGGRILSMSTANGLGNMFADLWEAATMTPGGAGLFAVFLSWRRHPDRDEAWYAAQLLLAEKSNKVPLLHQEHPSEPGEAFIQSGRPVFEQKVLVAHEQRIREELAAGFTPYQAERDGLTLYEAPVVAISAEDAPDHVAHPAYHYILSADVAEGLANGDWDDASVLCRETGDEVATLHGHWPPKVYAQKLYDLGMRYNTALLVVERNNRAYGVLDLLVSGDAHHNERGEPEPYPNLYHYQEPLAAGRRPEARPGWPTNVVTKPLAVNAMGAALAEGSYKPRDMAALTEMRIFSHNDNGSMSAPAGKHDDRVMSRAPGVYLLGQPDPVVRAMSFITDWAAMTQQRVDEAQQANAPGGVPGSTVRQ